MTYRGATCLHDRDAVERNKGHLTLERKFMNAEQLKKQ